MSYLKLRLQYLTRYPCSFILSIINNQPTGKVSYPVGNVTLISRFELQPLVYLGLIYFNIVNLVEFVALKLNLKDAGVEEKCTVLLGDNRYINIPGEICSK